MTKACRWSLPTICPVTTYRQSGDKAGVESKWQAARTDRTSGVSGVCHRRQADGARTEAGRPSVRGASALHEPSSIHRSSHGQDSRGHRYVRNGIAHEGGLREVRTATAAEAGWSRVADGVAVRAGCGYSLRITEQQVCFAGFAFISGVMLGYLSGLCYLWTRYEIVPAALQEVIDRAHAIADWKRMQ